jgi:hypothetical protein
MFGATLSIVAGATSSIFAAVRQHDALPAGIESMSNTARFI